MKIAVINETSAADKNIDIINALERYGHKIYNLGMTKSGEEPQLTYIHTGFLAGLLLNIDAVDLVIGGCGTGQGFLNSALQYPKVMCGLIQNPMDMWLFGQINGGNCISLALNFQYGWAGDTNLKFIFEKLFSLKEIGGGYPEHRKDSQQESRKVLNNISAISHYSFDEIINKLDEQIVKTVIEYPAVKKFLDIENIENEKIKNSLKMKIQ